MNGDVYSLTEYNLEQEIIDCISSFYGDDFEKNGMKMCYDFDDENKCFETFEECLNYMKENVL